MMQRYDRHLKLEGFGPAKQQLLSSAAVLIIGAGGLGVPVLQYLTAMGVGRIGIVEHDDISLTNLQRQVLYNTEEVGQPKLRTAVQRLQKLNPEVQFSMYDTWIMPDNALDIIQPYDVVVDCTDNFGTRYLVNDACVMLNKPFVYGAIHKYEGQVSVFNYKGGATYRCLFPEQPEPGTMLNCSDIGVLGILPGIIGSYQANETVKIITGIGEVLSNQLLTIDTLYNMHDTFQIRPVAGNHDIKALQETYDQPCDTGGVRSLSVHQLRDWLDTEKPLQLIDVREPDEWEICSIPQAMRIPMRMVGGVMAQLSKEIPVALLCHHGMRSLMIAQQLDAAGFPAVYNVGGGIHAWASEIDVEMNMY
ncbi:ThiF family adenylyltransferase [Chitinophaga pinensis]|uniref:Molybdopterin-synthase adenylyltransferase n=1 Tax=Chitinophaga pinensis TaxID=79329 RepID=A0A5C6LR41_9BACT|nr:ThiF family adenylyltransferase [Chitinophaga pinensis]TWV99067.1 thiamine biosynthesis protein ThiF [Chitinophaga pinensis]